ncbi:MAG: DUF5009 domain-containing protein [Melioribacteraceae bacterium]|nr:DUF5009 domain-containing protein [Melioribacteraceae bacterium]
MGTKSERLLSLDVFRGITIAGMILVNNPGSWGDLYPAVAHASWNGCTPTDLIFPFFLFIVGVAITYSLSKRKERGDNHSEMIAQIFKRSLTLFGLGLILNGFPFFTWSDGFSFIDFSTFRIMGVLQRIAIVYFISSVLFLKVSTKSLTYIGSGILIFYWLVMNFIPVPGFGMPDLLSKPGEIATNLSAWFDRIILGSHVWSGSAPWDPEGLFSTIPAIGTTIIGILTGQWLRKDVESSVKVVWLFVAGNFLLLGGYVTDMWFPINKGIWTSTYVIFTGGWALIFLAMCYWLIDVKGYKAWAKPFHVYGMNAIAVFFLSGVIGRLMYMIKIPFNGEPMGIKTIIYNNLYLSWLEPINASLAYALVYILIWLGLMWILYAKKIFIKV